VFGEHTILAQHNGEVVTRESLATLVQSIKADCSGTFNPIFTFIFFIVFYIFFSFFSFFFLPFSSSSCCTVNQSKLFWYIQSSFHFFFFLLFFFPSLSLATLLQSIKAISFSLFFIFYFLFLTLFFLLFAFWVYSSVSFSLLCKFLGMCRGSSKGN
jgi:hypothetical protein